MDSTKLPQLLITRDRQRAFLTHGRHALRLSQEQLAQLWGVSRARVARWEKLNGPDIPDMVFWALFGMLINGGKLAEVLADLLRAPVPEKRRIAANDPPSPKRWRTPY